MAGGLNTYGYAEANPVGAFDPLGLSAIGYGTGNWTSCDPLPNKVVCSEAGKRAIRDGIGAIPDETTNEDEDCGDSDCGSDTRATAFLKALEWAGLNQTDMIPTPWSQYGGRDGVNGAYVRSHGSQYYGFESPDNGLKQRVFNHPDGHPGQCGKNDPAHHRCPHFHAIHPTKGEKIFPYKRGT